MSNISPLRIFREACRIKKILFLYHGKVYKVPKNAVDQVRIVLPDKTVIRVLGWFDESNPPMAQGFEEVFRTRKKIGLEKIAKEFQAIIAEEHQLAQI